MPAIDSIGLDATPLQDGDEALMATAIERVSTEIDNEQAAIEAGLDDRSAWAKFWGQDTDLEGARNTLAADKATYGNVIMLRDRIVGRGYSHDDAIALVKQAGNATHVDDIVNAISSSTPEVPVASVSGFGAVGDLVESGIDKVADVGKSLEYAAIGIAVAGGVVLVVVLALLWRHGFPSAVKVGG